MDPKNSIEILEEFYYQLEIYNKNGLDRGPLKMRWKFLQDFQENRVEFIEKLKMVIIWGIISSEQRKTKETIAWIKEVNMQAKIIIFPVVGSSYQRFSKLWGSGVGVCMDNWLLILEMILLIIFYEEYNKYSPTGYSRCSNSCI